jgi:non-ribosomal peptide synthetase component F
MINLDVLLKICVDKGIKLGLQEGNLKVNAAKGLMTADLANALKFHKSALVERLYQQTGNDAWSLPKSNLRQSAPVSFAQKRFWMLHSISPESSAYHIPGSFALSGDLKLETFILAFQSVVKRHDILQTVYQEKNGELTQSVVSDRDFTVAVIDLTAQSDTQILKEAINAHKKQVFTSPFDLSKDFPLRIRLICTPNNYFEVLLCVHHIAADAWSIPLFLKELEVEYEDCCNNLHIDKPASHQYIDFAVWQQEKAQQGVYDQQLRYWQQQLADIPQLHDLITDYPRPTKSLGAIGVFDYRLSKAVLDQLTALGLTNQATLFSVLHTLLALLIFRWAGQQHIVVGSPVTGRHLKDLEPMLGCFINSIVINNSINDEQSFSDLLGQVKQTVQRAMQHQELPFEHLVEALTIDRLFGVNPVFQIMLALQQGGESQETFYDLKLHGSAASHAEAKVDLTLNVLTNDQGLTISWQYAKSLFKDETIKSMAETFAVLINQVIAKPTTGLTKFHLIDEKVIPQPNYLSDTKLLPERYYRYLEQNADQIVLIDQHKHWTGSQTLTFIKQVQGCCLTHQLQANDRVLLSLDKSVETYALVYALWGLGISYVPISSIMPAERLRLMAEQVQPKAIIYDGVGSTGQLPQIKLHIDVADIKNMSAEHMLLVNASLSDIAYILFTSGTTGFPKGVCVSHQQLTSFIGALSKNLPQQPMRLAIDSPLIFDASLASIGLMSKGHCLLAIPESVKTNTRQLIDLLSLHSIDLMFLSTSFLEILLSDDAFFNQSSVSFKFGGEACSQKLWDNIVQYCQQHNQFALNAYGPTETTVTISCPKVTSGEAHIGQPLQPNVFRVLDRYGHVCPAQMSGELEIKGPQVSLGYVDSSIDDNRKFSVTDGEFSSYKTGDIVTKLINGNHKFIGRRDSQIKFNGYRIELADIEAIAKYVPSISQIAAKVVLHNEQKFIALFYVGNQDEKTVKQYCEKHLPSYMQPHIIENRTSLSMTANGKIDKKQLQILLNMFDANYDLPDSGLLADIANVWRQNLPPVTLSTNSDFFSVGGHSLVAIKVIHQINQGYGITVPVSTLFERSVLSKFVEFLAEKIDDTPTADLLKELEDLDESALSALLEEL